MNKKVFRYLHLPIWATILLMAAIASVLLPPILVDSVSTTLVDSVQVLGPLVAKDAQLPPEELYDHLVSLSRGSQNRLTLIQADGTVIGDSSRNAEQTAQMDNHGSRPEIVQAQSDGVGSSIRRSDTTKRDYVYAASRTLDSEGNILYVRLARPLGAVQDFRVRLRAVLGLTLLIGFLLSLLVAYRMNLMVLNPLRKLAEAAGLFADHDHIEPLKKPKDPDLAHLVQSLNRMSSRYQELLDRGQRNSNQFRAIFNSLDEGILVVYEDEREPAANPRFYELFQGVVGVDRRANPLEVVRNAELHRLIELVWATNARHDREITLRNLSGGANVVLKVKAFPVTGTRTVAVSVHDLSPQVRLDSMRRDFIANLSHELKTPLASIRAYVETLKDLEDHEMEARQRFLGRCLEQSDRLEVLLADLLTLARLEDPQGPWSRERFDLKAAIDRLLQDGKHRGSAKNLKFQPEVEAVRSFVGSRDLVERIVGNLLENAIAYHREGGTIWVRVRTEDERLLVEVEDDGPGIPDDALDRIFERFYRVDHGRSRLIPDDALDRIFERFYRVDHGRSRLEGGTGLGLAIVKHAVEWHGGRVEVESEYGKGALFRVSLPMKGNNGKTN